MKSKIANHTPTPWKVEDGRSIVTPSGDFYIAYDNRETWRGSFVELDENVHYIVRAVNCHAELVDTMKDAIRYMRKYRLNNTHYKAMRGAFEAAINKAEVK